MDVQELDPDLVDPCPDIHALFCHYNDLYFQGSLGACSVQWSSKRMTLCAGTCSYQNGGGCVIKLSEPLLKFRPPKDLKETLLHEMIHAKIFLTSTIRDHEDHGPQFQSIMKGINQSPIDDHQRPFGGYDIGIYHTFRDEVQHHRRHAWTCQSCGREVRRAMNRTPSPSDCRSRPPPGTECTDSRCLWHTHEKTCGGAFVKTEEPEGYGEKGKGKKRKGEGGAETTGGVGAGRKGALDAWVKKGSKEPATSARDAAAQAAEKRWQENNAADEKPVDEGEGKKRQRRGNGWVAPKNGVAGDPTFVDLDASPGKEVSKDLEPGSKAVPPRQSGDGKPARAKREEVNLVESTPITKFFRKREGPAEERERKVPRLDLSTPESKGGSGSRGLAEFQNKGKDVAPVVDGDGWEVFPLEEDVGTAVVENTSGEQRLAGEELVRAPSEDGPAFRRKGCLVGRADGEAGLDTTTRAQAVAPPEENGVNGRANGGAGTERGSEGSDQDGDVSEEESDPEWTEGMRNKRTRWERKTRGRRRKKSGKKVVREESDSEDLLELDPRPSKQVGSGAKRERCSGGEEMEWEKEEGVKSEPEKKDGIRKYFLRKGAAQGGIAGDRAPGSGGATIDLDEDADAEQGVGSLQDTRRGKKRKRSSGKEIGLEKPVAFEDPDWRGVERYGVLRKQGIGVADVGNFEVNWQRRVQWMKETVEEGDWEGRLESKRQRRVGPEMGGGDGSSEPTQGGQVSGEMRGGESMELPGGSGLQRERSDVSEEMGAMRLDSSGPVEQEQAGSGGAIRMRKASVVSRGDGLGGAEKVAPEIDAKQSDSGNEESQAEAKLESGDRLRGWEEARTRGAKLTEEELQAALRSGLDEEPAELDVLPAAETKSQGYGSGGHNRSRRVLALSSQDSYQSGDAGDRVQKAGLSPENPEGQEEPSEEAVVCPLCQKRFPAGTNEEAVNAHANQCLDQGTV